MDAVGGLAAAEEWVRKQADVPASAPVRELQPPKKWLEEFLPAGWAGWATLHFSPKPQYLYLAE